LCLYIIFFVEKLNSLNISLPPVGFARICDCVVGWLTDWAGWGGDAI